MTMRVQIAVRVTLAGNPGGLGGILSHKTAAAPRPESFRPIAVVEELTDVLVEGASGGLTKPRLRGWIHLYCAVAAAIAGTALVAVSWAEASKRAGHSTLTYVLAIVAMFAVSAVYHRVDWRSATARKWMRRLDHSMIFVLIAGSYNRSPGWRCRARRGMWCWRSCGAARWLESR